MARKRAYKKRVDYRKGGRVKYQEGSEVFDPNTGEPLGPGSFVPPPKTGGGGATGGGGGTADPNAKAKADARAKFDLIPATGNYTEEQTKAVQDAIKIGAITTQEAATKFGVQPDQISQEIARREQVADTGTTDIANPYATAPLPDMVAKQQQAAAVSNIPADGRYTPAETQQVVNALNTGAITSQQAADQFGATVEQVEAELARQNQVADTGTTDILDPFAGGVQAATRPTLLKRAGQ